MLKGISPLISPELLKVLCEMGHGDEIVLADANFPAESMGQRVVRAEASARRNCCARFCRCSRWINMMKAILC